MTLWHSLNTSAYRLRYAWLARRARRTGARRNAARRTAAQHTAASPRLAGAEPRVLHAAWGRIGDAVLSTGILKHFRTLFPGATITHLGRAETRAIVAPFVDEFVPLEESESIVGPFETILTDLHMFYGGTFELGALLEAIPAQRKLLYEGYHRGPGLAPIRFVPAGFEVVPMRPRDVADLDARHLLLDGAHYLSELGQRLHGDALTPADTRPELQLELPNRPEFEGAIAWQPFSNNSKKDYPADRWRRVLSQFNEQRFIALGTDRQRVDDLKLPNVENLCGQTSLTEAAAVIAASRAFLGPDSGLTHVAAALGRPTVCVTQSSNLGYFFPYPRNHGFGHVHTVAHPQYRECSGCFMTCAHEPINATARRGALCLRELHPQAVRRELSQTLRTAQAAPSVASLVSS